MNPAVQVPPPMPPEAAPFPVRQAIGREAVASLWEGCYRTGVAAGKIEAGVDYAKGCVHTGIGCLSLIVITLSVAVLVLIKGKSGR